MDIVLVDRSPILGERLSLLLGDLPHMRVVAEARTAAAARNAAKTLAPDAVVVDLALGDSGGLRLLREIRAIRPCALMVVVTNDPSPTYHDRCTEVADLCLDKTHDMDALLRALTEGAASVSRRAAQKGDHDTPCDPPPSDGSRSRVGQADKQI